MRVRFQTDLQFKIKRKGIGNGMEANRSPKRGYTRPAVMRRGRPLLDTMFSVRNRTPPVEIGFDLASRVGLETARSDPKPPKRSELPDFVAAQAMTPICKTTIDYGVPPESLRSECLEGDGAHRCIGRLVTKPGHAKAGRSESLEHARDIPKWSRRLR